MSLHPKTPPRTEVAHVGSAQEGFEKTAADETTSRRGCRHRLRGCFLKTLLLSSVVIIISLIGFYVSQPRYYNILIIGSDQRANERARSDVLLLVAIPKSRRDQLSLITIPRDTKIEHSEKGLQKITHFYAMWDDSTDRLGNRALTTQVVEDLLDIHVQGTVEVTFDSFDELIDLLGGVDLGQGNLTGADAEELVHNRFVQPSGDFGRAAEQRDIIKNLLPKLYQPSKARAVYEYFLTSDRARLTISRPSLMAFGLAYLIGHRGRLSPGELNEAALPGTGTRIYTPSFDKSLYYWELDDAATKALSDRYLR